jgi:hypothetical protein
MILRGLTFQNQYFTTNGTYLQGKGVCVEILISQNIDSNKCAVVVN